MHLYRFVAVALVLAVSCCVYAEEMSDQRALEVIAAAGLIKEERILSYANLALEPVTVKQAQDAHYSFIDRARALPTDQAAEHLFLHASPGLVDEFLATATVQQLSAAIDGIATQPDFDSARLDAYLQSVLRDFSPVHTRVSDAIRHHPAVSIDPEQVQTVAEALYRQVMLSMSDKGKGTVVEAALLGTDFALVADQVRQQYVESGRYDGPVDIPIPRLLELVEQDPATWTRLFIFVARRQDVSVLEARFDSMAPMAKFRAMLSSKELGGPEQLIAIGEWALQQDNLPSDFFIDWSYLAEMRAGADAFAWLNEHLADYVASLEGKSINFPAFVIVNDRRELGLSPELVARLILSSENLSFSRDNLEWLYEFDAERAAQYARRAYTRWSEEKEELTACDRAALVAFDQVTGSELGLSDGFHLDAGRELTCYHVIVQWAVNHESIHLLDRVIDEIVADDELFWRNAESVLNRFEHTPLHRHALERLKADYRWPELEQRMQDQERRLMQG